MHEYLRTLSARIGLPTEACLYAEPIAEALDGDGLLERCWAAILARGDGAAILDAEAERFGCEPNRLRLAACLLLTRSMRAEYERRGIDLAIYEASLADIPIWAKCCKAETGLWGMKQFHWLQNTLGVRLWRLGRMQFELVPFEAERYERGGRVLHRGDTVVNTHIPEGDPFGPEAQEDSFRRAMAFFSRKEFVCESWMLWPAHREMLPETSNIRVFMERFDIIESWEKPGVNDLWRIFGYLQDYSPNRLPRRTGLQRAYADRLARNGGLTGGGYGVLLL